MTRPSEEAADSPDLPSQAFRALIESVGVKRFAAGMELSTRQVNRMLSGAQPNPVERLIRSLACAAPEAGDRVLDLVCQEMGGYFIREETIDSAAVNAVRECAEAIAAISDGHISKMDEVAIREAVAALTGLAKLVRQQKVRRVNVLAGESRAPAPGGA